MREDRPGFSRSCTLSGGVRSTSGVAMRLLGVSPDWPRGSQACFQHTCSPGEMPCSVLGTFSLWRCGCVSCSCSWVARCCLLARTHAQPPQPWAAVWKRALKCRSVQAVAVPEASRPAHGAPCLGWRPSWGHLGLDGGRTNLAEALSPAGLVCLDPSLLSHFCPTSGVDMPLVDPARSAPLLQEGGLCVRLHPRPSAHWPVLSSWLKLCLGP